MFYFYLAPTAQEPFHYQGPPEVKKCCSGKAKSLVLNTTHQIHIYSTFSPRTSLRKLLLKGKRIDCDLKHQLNTPINIGQNYVYLNQRKSQCARWRGKSFLCRDPQSIDINGSSLCMTIAVIASVKSWWSLRLARWSRLPMAWYRSLNRCHGDGPYSLPCCHWGRVVGLNLNILPNLSKNLPQRCSLYNF